MRYVIHTKDGVEIFRGIWDGEITSDLPRDYGVDMVIVNEPDPPKPIDAQALDVATNQALAADDDHLFSDTDDISEKQALEAALAQKDEELALANERIAELESREPEVRIERVEVERIVEEAEEFVEGEPMPDALRDSLARLVTPDANEAAKKAALMQRWITLKAQMEELKLFERDRKLPPISRAEMAEFEQLEAYMGWFK